MQPDWRITETTPCKLPDKKLSVAQHTPKRAPNPVTIIDSRMTNRNTKPPGHPHGPQQTYFPASLMGGHGKHKTDQDGRNYPTVDQLMKYLKAKQTTKRPSSSISCI